MAHYIFNKACIVVRQFRFGLMHASGGKRSVLRLFIYFLVELLDCIWNNDVHVPVYTSVKIFKASSGELVFRIFKASFCTKRVKTAVSTVDASKHPRESNRS